MIMECALQGAEVVSVSCSFCVNFGREEKPGAKCKLTAKWDIRMVKASKGKLSNVSYLDTIDVRVHTDEDLESLQKDSVGANKHLVTLTC